MGQEGLKIGEPEASLIYPPEEPSYEMAQEYMSHHYAYMMKVVEVRELESYVEVRKDVN